MKRTFALLCLVAVGASIGCDGEKSSADKDAQFKEDVHTIAEFIRASEERSDEMASQARVETTGKAIEALGQAVLIYQIKVGRLPMSLRDLTKGINDDDEGLLKSNDVIDAWGNPFEYKVDGKKYTIRSAGPDGQMNTEDDITN